MYRVLFHSAALIVTVFVSFILSKTLPVEYDLQLTALLFIIYFIVRRFSKNAEVLTSTTFTLIIMNVILTSGGAHSPYFFLLYFLLFALALMLEPIVSITTSFAIMLLFIFDMPPNQPFEQLVPLMSLPFLTPFALFLGDEYRKNLRQKRRIGLLQLKDSLLEDELRDKQEDAYIFLTVVVKSHLDSLREMAENFTGDHELESIRRTIRRMEHLIDKYTNEN
jgi:hypothetical protein